MKRTNEERQAIAVLNDSDEIQIVGALIAQLKSYVSLMEYVWPEVYKGNDVVYNQAKSLLTRIHGGKQ